MDRRNRFGLSSLVHLRIFSRILITSVSQQYDEEGASQIICGDKHCQREGILIQDFGKRSQQGDVLSLYYKKCQ